MIWVCKSCQMKTWLEEVGVWGRGVTGSGRSEAPPSRGPRGNLAPSR